MGILEYTENFNLAKYESGSDDWGGGINNNFDIIDAYLNSAILQSSPIGIIFMYGSEIVPDGWLMCDGTSLLKTEFSELFDVIGTRFGSTDDSHFNIPDMRGMFARGFDNGAGNDADASSRTALNSDGATGDNVGSYQEDGIRNITGFFDNNIHTTPEATLLGGHTGCFFYNNSKYLPGIYHSNYGTRNSRTNFDASRSVPTGSDNRPKNVSTAFIIKF